MQHPYRGWSLDAEGNVIPIICAREPHPMTINKQDWHHNPCMAIRRGTMALYEIFGFDAESPHWDTAIIRADTEEHAKSILADHLAGDISDDTFWGSAEPMEDWEIREVPEDEKIIFFLGGGCR